MVTAERLRKAAATIEYLSSKKFEGPGVPQILYDYFDACRVIHEYQIEKLEKEVTELKQTIRTLSLSLNETSRDPQ